MNAARPTRAGYRSGHYDRNLTTTSGDVTLHMLRLKGITFESTIIEQYRHRERCRGIAHRSILCWPAR